MTAQISKRLGVKFFGAALLFVLVVAFTGAQFFSSERRFGFPRSDPPNDFKRFVMGGPHWADEDHEDGYDPNAVTLPKGVRVLLSMSFSDWMEEGAVLYFRIDQKDLDGIFAADDFEPTNDAEEKERLNYWSTRYLGVSTDSLGSEPSFYITKISHDNVIRTLMAVNQDRTRVIFLHVNFN